MPRRETQDEHQRGHRHYDVVRVCARWRVRERYRFHVAHQHAQQSFDEQERIHEGHERAVSECQRQLNKGVDQLCAAP